MIKATLRLFRGIYQQHGSNDVISDNVVAEMIEQGFIVDPDLSVTAFIVKAIEDIYGLSGEQVNNTFHKSWSVIRNSGQHELALHQMKHYASTYGTGFSGKYVYLPTEVLSIPEVTEDIPLTYIRRLSISDIKDGIYEMAGTNVALSQQVIADIMSIVESRVVVIDPLEVNNRELKTLLCDYYNIAPDSPEDWLRFVIWKITGETLVIKNHRLCRAIIDSGKAQLLGDYLDQRSVKIEQLAEIYYRFKPLFLALRHLAGKNHKAWFNRIAKLAPVHHKPIKMDYIARTTELIATGKFDLGEFSETIKDQQSPWRLIRLAEALNYRLNSNGNRGKVYRIRNGQNWLDSDYEWNPTGNTLAESALNAIVVELGTKLRPKLEGVKVYMPNNVGYIAPSSGKKMFFDRVPLGTNVFVPGNMIVGVHWEGRHHNGSNDLDLSAMLKDGTKIGWDSAYQAGDILYSGDMTSARPFATESVYAGRLDDPIYIYLNYYSPSESDWVEAKLFVANENPTRFSKNYTCDPNNIVFSAPFRFEGAMDKKQVILGLIETTPSGNVFRLADLTYGRKSVSSVSRSTEILMDASYTESISGLSLLDVLIASQVQLVGMPEKADIDLSSENLQPGTLIEMLAY